MADFVRAPGPIEPGLKIGLLGGSFNPAHIGHLHVSQMAMKKLGLDYVWWLVAPQNPLKPTIGMAPLAKRLAYAANTFERHPRIIVIDLEAALGTRYTIDTLKKLKARFPAVHFVWLMGSDNLSSFHRWRRWREIAQRIPIAVMLRPGSTLAPLCSKAGQYLLHHRQPANAEFTLKQPPALAILDGQRSPVSATAIRAGTAAGEALVRAIPSC